MTKEEITIVIIILLALIVIWFDKNEPYIYTRYNVDKLNDALVTSLSFYISKHARKVGGMITLDNFNNLSNIPSVLHNSMYMFIISHENKKALYYMDAKFNCEVGKSRYDFYIRPKRESIQRALITVINENFNESILEDIEENIRSKGNVVKDGNKTIVVFEREYLEKLLLTDEDLYDDMAKITMGLVHKINAL